MVHTTAHSDRLSVFAFFRSGAPYFRKGTPAPPDDEEGDAPVEAEAVEDAEQPSAEQQTYNSGNSIITIPATGTPEWIEGVTTLQANLIATLAEFRTAV